MQIWIHDSKMRKITALNNDIPDMLSYTNSAWHPYLDQATSTFDFTIPKFSNGELHEDIKLINDECFVSFYVNDSYQVFYIATLQEDDFNIQLTCNNTNLEYALEYANPFSSESAQTIEWYLNHMDLLSFAAVEIGFNEISDRKRTLTFDSQETKMNRLQSLMTKFEAEFEFKVELNRDGTYKRIVINIYQKNGIGTDRKDVVLYYSNGLKGVQVSSDKTQMFNAGVFDGKNGVNLANVEFSEKNADGVEEFYSRKGDIFVYAPLSMQRYPATMRPGGQDNWIRKDFQTEYENVNDLKAYALRTLKQYAYPLVTYTASVQSGFVSQHTDLKLGDTIRIIDNNFAGGLALEARVSEMIISFDNPANNSFIFTNYRKIDNKPSAALQTRIEQAVESKLPYRIELATTGGVTFKNNEGETIVKPSLYKGNLPYTKDVSWHWALGGVATVGTQYRIQARDITDSEVLTVAAHVGNLEVATTEITLTNVNDGKKSSYYSDTFPEDNPKGTLEKGDSLFLTDGDTVKQYYWNGTEWVINPIVSDVEALKEQIAEDLKDVPNREEFENKIAEELASSKAEIETQIETAKTQAESNAKEYADTINQETAKVAEQAKTAADEIKADLVNVKSNLTSTSIVANNAQAAVDEAKQDLAEVASDLNTAKQDLMSHAQQLQTQANAQTELSKRVTTVETTANGTKTTVNELTKTVGQNGKDITSVTNRTKTVEDDLANTKTTLTQVQTTANSTSQKTATLETGLNGLTAKFTNLSVGNKNYLPASRVVNRGATNFRYNETSKSWTMSIPANQDAWGKGIYFNTDNLNIALNGGETLFFGMMIKANKTCSFNFDINNYASGSSSNDNDERSKAAWYPTNKIIPANTWTRVWFSYTAKDNVPIRDNNSNFGITGNTETVDVELKEIIIAKSNVPVDYQEADADIESKVAEYKQTADQNYASLSSTVQTLDGTVKQNKSEFDQTASQLKTTISAVEGKIPTSVGSVNLFKGSRDFSGTGWANNFNGDYAEDYQGVKIYKTQVMWVGRSQYFEVKAGEEYVFSAYVKSSAKTDKVNFYLPHESKQPMATGLVELGSDNRQDSVNIGLTDEFQRIAVKIKITKDGWIMPRIERYNADNYLYFGGYKLERGNVATDWSPAPEDTVDQISSLSSQIQQTADGMTLLATKTELNTLSGRVTTAENNIIAKANELSSKITSVEGKIPTSIGGRNLLTKTNQGKTNWSWVISSGGTTAENYNVDGVNAVKLTRTSDSSASWHYIRYDGLLRNLVEPNTQYTLSFDVKPSVDVTFTVALIQGDWSGLFTDIATMNKATANQWTKVSCVLTSKTTLPDALEQVVYLQDMPTANGNWLIIKNIKLEKGVVSSDWSPAPEDYDSKLATVQSEFKQTTDSIKASVQSLDNSTVKSSSLTINTDGVVIKAGKSTSDFANAVGSYFSVNQNAINLFSDKINVKGNMIVSGAITSDKIASKQINTSHLNGKIITADVISSNAVTADAIRAGAVTTDKMSANSINGDRITAGTLDAAKIRAGSITASQIASGTITSAQIKTGTISAANIAAGAITSDKIAANSIDASKIVTNGLTANIIKGGVLQSLNGSTNFELDTGKLFYNNNNTGVFRVQDGASTMGLKFSNTSVTVSGTSRILSRVILGGDRNESTLDDGRWDKGGFSGLVIETIKGAIPAVNEHADSLRAISDTIYFTHTYSADSPTGVSAHGWKMETYAPDSSISGNIVLKPYGINYRQSDIVVGDVRLDNGDGSGYWMRATINTLKACFGHIINGGVSENALNAIRSELNKISGT